MNRSPRRALERARSLSRTAPRDGPSRARFSQCYCIPARGRGGRGEERTFRDAVFDWLEEKSSVNFPGVTLFLRPTNQGEYVANGSSAPPQNSRSCRKYLPRFDLPKEQMDRILSDQRADNCLEASLTEIPATIRICWPSSLLATIPTTSSHLRALIMARIRPQTSGANFSGIADDWRRLRALWWTGRAYADEAHVPHLRPVAAGCEPPACLVA